jgi:hypothetical protein
MTPEIITQLGLFDNTDPRERPVIVAEKWGFDLARYERKNGNLYAVRDWLSGLVGETSTDDAIRNLRRSQIVFSKHSLDYVAKDGKTYKREYTDQYGLYQITQSYAQCPYF